MDFVLVAQGVPRAGTYLGNAVQVCPNAVLTSTGLKISHEALE